MNEQIFGDYFLLNGIRQIIYCLYQEKDFNKKVYNNIINSIKS